MVDSCGICPFFGPLMVPNCEATGAAIKRGSEGNWCDDVTGYSCSVGVGKAPRADLAIGHGTEEPVAESRWQLVRIRILMIIWIRVILLILRSRSGLRMILLWILVL